MDDTAPGAPGAQPDVKAEAHSGVLKQEDAADANGVEPPADGGSTDDAHVPEEDEAPRDDEAPADDANEDAEAGDGEDEEEEDDEEDEEDEA